MNILLGLTGSVATIVAQKLERRLLDIGDVKTVATQSAAKILDTVDWSVDTESWFKEILYDNKEWQWNKKGDPVLHVDLAEWTDVLVIAPLSANTLGKIANGICDNLLTCIYRCYDIDKPVVLAPAMNTNMWKHPSTDKCIKLLENNHNYRIYDPKCVFVGPVEKQLACGTVGIGAMANVEDIAQAVERFRK
jgi:phosphopantothenoylcysteine synthetase/decarboxylase